MSQSPEPYNSFFEANGRGSALLSLDVSSQKGLAFRLHKSPEGLLVPDHQPEVTTYYKHHH